MKSWERPRNPANPFSQSPQVFSMRREQTAEGAAIVQRFREAQRVPKPGAEHLVSVVDLHDYLEKTGRVDACAHAFSCDPWKYEPAMLDDIFAERNGANDPQKIDQLRRLIRAGSWMTYERLERKDVDERLSAVLAQETASRNWKIRQADPDTAKEHKEDLREVEEAIRKIRNAIDQRVNGEELEEVTRLVEDMTARLWLEVKQLKFIHGLQTHETRTHHLTKPFIQEIERLRPIRDLLYYRRLYPKQAARAIQPPTAGRP